MDSWIMWVIPLAMSSASVVFSAIVYSRKANKDALESAYQVSRESYEDLDKRTQRIGSELRECKLSLRQCNEERRDLRREMTELLVENRELRRTLGVGHNGR